ncbi:MAG: type II secretion system ATPase GspE [Pseudomonadota bacterium]
MKDMLKNRFGITEAQLSEAGWDNGVPAGAFLCQLVKQHLLSETQRVDVLAELTGCPFWPELPIADVDNAFSRIVPIHFLKKYGMVPLINGGAEPVIAINDPVDVQAADDLARMLGLASYQTVLSTREAILTVIHMSYDFGGDSAEQLVQDLEETGATVIDDMEAAADLMDDDSEAPIIRLVNTILSRAIKARASDIHIETYQASFKIRYRVDGVLYDMLTPPRWIQPALISRIKVMASLDIAEKRLPQDGRFEVRVGSHAIDVRVSTLPTSFGERVVMRLLSKSAEIFNLTELGMADDLLTKFNELCRSPNGIILVTGPTGSGKTTTLYAVLSTINTPDVNIITIEDPVEYQIMGISQIQVNPKIDLTFARGLRAIVRQDPDVILVGEMRDRETAQIGVQSALTGHLVFSTLHTNDSAGAITRLVDIGVEPFLIASSVLAVVAQRLVRVLCSGCKVPHTPDDALLEQIGITAAEVADGTVFEAGQCERCLKTGYRGRIGVFEVMEMRAALRSLVLKTHDANEIKVAAVRQGMITLNRDGVRKVLAGQTTVAEVMRATQR